MGDCLETQRRRGLLPITHARQHFRLHIFPLPITRGQPGVNSGTALPDKAVDTATDYT